MSERTLELVLLRWWYLGKTKAVHSHSFVAALGCLLTLDIQNEMNKNSELRIEDIEIPVMEKVLQLLKGDPPRFIEAPDASPADLLALKNIHFFYHVGMVSMCPRLKRVIGKYTWDHLGVSAWCCEAATAATFMDVATTRDNIIHNIKNKDESGVKKKKSKMITKQMWPDLMCRFAEYYQAFADMMDNDIQVEKFKRWEEKVGIFKQAAASHAMQRAAQGPKSQQVGQNHQDDESEKKRVSFGFLFPCCLGGVASTSIL